MLMQTDLLLGLDRFTPWLRRIPPNPAVAPT